MKKKILLSIAVIVGLSLGACGSSSSSDAFLRVLHLSPDAPAVDVLLNEEVILEDVAYTQSSGYLPTSRGQNNVKVNAAGTDLTVIDADITLESRASYTVIASGLLELIAPIVLQDDRSPAVSGLAAVRVVHGAPSAPEVDVYVTEVGADLADATPVLQGVPFGVASDYLEVPAGEYQVRVTLAGTTTVAIDSGAVTLPSEGRFTAIARDETGGGAPFGLILLSDR